MTQEKILTAKIVVDLLKQIKADSGDRVPDEACSYQTCLVGELVKRWDESAWAELVSEEAAVGRSAVYEVFGEEGEYPGEYDLSFTAEKDAIDILSAAQLHQDYGYIWSVAVGKGLERA